MIRRVQFYILISTILLSACGFHLRQQNVLPPSLHCLKIDSLTPYGEFESNLRRLLTGLGVQVTRTGCAPVTIRILSTRLFSDVPTIGGSNQAQVYVYYYQVNFELLDIHHQTILPSQCVTNGKTLIVNPGNTLGSTSQLETLKNEMQLEASHMIINILNSQNFCR